MQQDCLLTEFRPHTNVYISLCSCISFFCVCDLDLDPITLTYELDLDILKIHHIKMKFLGQGFQKLEHEEDGHTQTDATERITTVVFTSGN